MGGASISPIVNHGPFRTHYGKTPLLMVKRPPILRKTRPPQSSTCYTVGPPSYRLPPMTVILRPSVPDILIYADAATPSRILSAITIPADTYKSSGSFDQCFSETADRERGGSFRAMGGSYIYGIEILAILAIMLCLCRNRRGGMSCFILTRVMIWIPLLRDILRRR